LLEIIYNWTPIDREHIQREQMQERGCNMDQPLVHTTVLEVPGFMAGAGQQ